MKKPLYLLLFTCSFIFPFYAAAQYVESGNSGNQDLPRNDIIVTNDLEIIDAIIVEMNDEVITYRVLPIRSEDDPVLSIAISEVASVRLRNGEEMDFTGDASHSSVSNNGDEYLSVDGLYICNSKMQKLTYETASRYLGEDEIDRYRHLHRRGKAGKVVAWIGGGVFSLSLSMMSTYRAESDSSGMFVAIMTGFAGGLTVGLLGFMVESMCETRLEKMVSAWNDRQRQEKVSLRIGTTNSGGFGLAFNF